MSSNIITIPHSTHNWNALDGGPNTGRPGTAPDITAQFSLEGIILSLPEAAALFRPEPVALLLPEAAALLLPEAVVLFLP